MSFKLCSHLADVFPHSTQVRLIGLDQASDRDVWEFAGLNGYILVSQDADMAEMATYYGSPPKVIWLRMGNQPTASIHQSLRRHRDVIERFFLDDELSCLEIF
ncbi:DUF5615 family PIN-like protein [Jiella marina]|uniref:DUF5615 family PIN-like protein n=1 Tax=Jiella sp. LLJ827 TaxID=2917712 RepID=UPI0021010435|nr:DUF5615 family PIN-like protein [Jiella sp. LLJ827]MCQ0986600.1 DUF5615 family PIN-like protein [Jiella sp. LLJ827]